MATPYKLRCSVFGHEKDVRALCAVPYPENAFVSASRDVTARLWTPNEAALEYTEGHCMSGHSNFVIAVCVMPPNDAYPHGLIMTGSNDNNIHAYSLESPQPQFKLTGHANTVCALSAGKFGSLLSGSWDSTAKVWLNQKCVMTLTGHEAAVWAVAIMPEGGYMLTGSADKTIRLWRAGKCERTFKGHEDCVRSVAVLSSAEFLSCSNDATIRRWLTSGECTHTYYGHNNYIYCLAVMPNGVDFVTGSEDRTLKIWCDNECQQTIAHPTETVWAVTVLGNGDIVTGSSDGVIRIFSANPERHADEEQQKAFEEQVSSSTINTQLGDIDPKKLPGPEALFNPGKQDGQTMMIKTDSGQVEAHQWNASDGQWSKVGDVVGSKGGAEETSGQTTFMGKKYDYVFSVEIEEGKPPLKLPYNTGDDPWMSAHKFLERNDMSPLFLDQVAKFIQDQCKGVTLGQAAPPPTVSDPLTGGGRYIPGSGSGDNTREGSQVDPFTGAGRYVPAYGQTAGQPTAPPASFGSDPLTGSTSYRPPTTEKSQVTSNPYFPKTSYLTFETANHAAILGKLTEFNKNVDDSSKVSSEALQQMAPLMEARSATAQQLTTLWTMLQWPPGMLFPVLDVLRLSIRAEETNQHFFNVKDGPDFISHLLSIISKESIPANLMLVLRTLCNSFKHSTGEQAMISQHDQILSAMADLDGNRNKNIQIALASLLLNYTVAFQKGSDIEAKSQCLSVVATISERLSDAEAKFRMLVGLGTLVADDNNSIALARSLDLMSLVTDLSSVADPAKVGECARLVATLLK